MLITAALLLACAAHLPAADSPLVPTTLKVISSTYFSPNFIIELHGNTLTYQVSLYCEPLDRMVTAESTQVDPTPDDWARFRQALDQINVWRWRRKYEIPMVLDGTGWYLKVRYAGKQIESTGNNGYPGPDGKFQESSAGKPTAPYYQLMAAVSALAGGRQFDSTIESDRYIAMILVSPKIEIKNATLSDTLDFLRQKGTDALQAFPNFRAAKMTFVVNIPSGKLTERVNYQGHNVPYATLLANVLHPLGLDYEVLAVDKIAIHPKSLQ